MSHRLSLPLYWESPALSDCLVLNDSGTWGTVGSEGNGFPVLRSTNIQDGELVFDDVAWCDISPEIASKYELQDGDIILTKSSGSSHLVGKNALFVHPNDGKHYLFSNFTQRLRVNTSIVLPAYLYFYLNSPFASAFLAKMQSTTSGLRNLSIKLYVTQIIPLPALPEQRRIVDFLHEANILRRWRKQANKLIEKLTLSTFQMMFYDASHKWESAKLVDLCKEPDDIKCGPFGTQLKSSEYKDSGVPLWSIPHVNNHFTSFTTEFLSQEKAKKLDGYSLLPGDIVMTRKATVGNCTIYPENFEKGIMHSDLLRARVDRDKCLPEYLYGELAFSGHVSNQITSLSAGAVTKGINVGKLKQIVVNIPPMPLQIEFAKRYEKIKNIEKDIQYGKHKLDELMTSIVARAFTGELTENWREKHKDELQRSAVERDKALGLRGEKPRLIDFKEGRVTPEELEGIRQALGNFAVHLASYHIDVDGLARSLEGITKPLAQSLVSMSQNLITPFLESFRQSLQNIQLTLPEIRLPDEEDINRQIDLLPLPQEKRAIHDVLDITSIRVLKLAHASPAYFTPEDLTFGGITSTHTSASLRVLDSLGFVRLVEIDGVLRYHLIDANTDTALKPDQLQQ